jgi:hypothetical protein
MATQRFTIATIAGEAGEVVARLFASWQAARLAEGWPDAVLRAVDRFAEQLRANGDAFPVLYFCEWIDHWLMGDAMGPGFISGGRFWARCLSATEAADQADQCGNQFHEQEWLAARLREAAVAWQPLVPSATVVLLRQPLGPFATDEEVVASLQGIPAWLSAPQPVTPDS